MTARRTLGGYVAHVGPASAPETLVSVGIAARMLGYAPSVVREHCASGRVPTRVSLGGHYRIPAAWVRRYSGL